MSRMTFPTLALAVVALWACGGGGDSEGDEERDLSLAPAESLVALNDQPAVAPEPGAEPTQAPRPARRSPAPQPPAEPPAPAALPAGTMLQLAASDSISSRTNTVGDAIAATATADITGADGTVLVPAGAVFEGVIEQIEGASGPGGQGTLVLAFNRVTFGGGSYSMEARTDSLGTEMRAQGITAGDAAKVGVGAAAGAIAGRILGGRTEGAVVGGVVGAAAGAGIAVATKDRDIVLPAGGMIRLVLAAPMVLQAIP